MNDKNIPKEIENLKYWTTALYDILELNKDFVVQKKDIWKVDCQSLLQKEACHALSVLDLLEGTKPKINSIESNINFIDYTSIYSIVRSALESYLVFNYIFLDKKANVRVKKLRFKIWHASSLSQRQKQLSTSEKTNNILKKEKSKYLKLRREILNSKTFFQSISLTQKKKLKDKKPFDWKPQDGWLGIASSSVLSEKYWIDVYNILSSVVHSNAVITNHFSSKDPKEIQERSALTATSFLNYIIPLFIDGYGSIFPRVKNYLEINDSLIFNIKVAKGVVSGYGTN